MISKTWVGLFVGALCCGLAHADLGVSQREASAEPAFPARQDTSELDVEWLMSGAYKRPSAGATAEPASAIDFSTYTLDETLWAGTAPIGGWQSMVPPVQGFEGPFQDASPGRLWQSQDR